MGANHLENPRTNVKGSRVKKPPFISLFDQLPTMASATRDTVIYEVNLEVSDSKLQEYVSTDIC